jgi:hypothetical protein
MNRPVVDRIASALLYEGYLLYPYRRSVKNRQRWTFGGLYPPAYTAAQGGGADASGMQTQCLVRGRPDAVLSVTVRFLQVVARQVGAFETALEVWPEYDRPPACHHVESLEGEHGPVVPWQEAVEREVPLPDVSLGELAANPRRVEFDFVPESSDEPVRGPAGSIVGMIERAQRRINGGASLAAEIVADGLYRVTVRVENGTHYEGGGEDREQALLQTLVSTHTILVVAGGEFLSLLDPPARWRSEAEACANVGTWPVLVGDPGQADTMLSSPIILYDYPQVAPESPGDLFDATEIDEILTLRILALTDEEKRSVAALDDRGRALLERIEALAREQLLGLHGTLRTVPRATGPEKVCLAGVEYRLGGRVRLWPLGDADILDLALKGKTAVIAALEQDYENRFHVAVTVDDDPGRDLGLAGQPGHRFFFRPEEVEPLDDEKGDPS